MKQLFFFLNLFKKNKKYGAAKAVLIFYMSLANSQVIAALMVAIPASNTFALDVLIRELNPGH